MAGPHPLSTPRVYEGEAAKGEIPGDASSRTKRGGFSSVDFCRHVLLSQVALATSKIVWALRASPSSDGRLFRILKVAKLWFLVQLVGALVRASRWEIYWVASRDDDDLPPKKGRLRRTGCLARVPVFSKGRGRRRMGSVDSWPLAKPFT